MVSFDVTSLVQGWVNDGAGNEGMVLKSTVSDGYVEYQFASSEYGTVNLRPKLTVTYSSTSGKSKREGSESEARATSSVATEYYYAGSTRVAMRKDGVLYYLLSDHLGSTTVVVDAQGQKVSQQRYYPFGGVRWSEGTLPTDRQFTGQRLEAGLGLYDYKARYYDPAIGRFVQPDTAVPRPGNPQSLNRYSYVDNNPLRYTDPSGHRLDTLLDIAFIASDIHDIATNGLNWKNGFALVADTTCAFLPARSHRWWGFGQSCYPCRRRRSPRRNSRPFGRRRQTRFPRG